MGGFACERLGVGEDSVSAYLVVHRIGDEVCTVMWFELLVGRHFKPQASVGPHAGAIPKHNPR